MAETVKDKPAAAPLPWSPAQAQGANPETPKAELDRAVSDLQKAKDSWVRLAVGDRIRILERLLRDYEAVAPEAVAAACRAKGLDSGDPRAGEEWLAGPLLVQRNLRLLAQSLSDILAHGVPRIPGAVTTRKDGQVVARVFPDGALDKLMFKGLTAEVWMEPGVAEANLRDHQARIYRRGAERSGKVALVLGAGNVAAIGPTDVLYKLFVEDQVCLLKMNPVNEYLGPFVERGFRVLVEGGFLRVVYGGAAVGKHLTAHPGIDEIHITGSDKTHDTIVWGPPGPERDERIRKKTPLCTKRITSELGNVSPVVVVPGPWSQDDVEFHALNVASQVQNNASFNCNAAKVLIQQAGWSERANLVAAIRKRLRDAPSRRAYYPGAEERYDAFLKAHPEAEPLGVRASGVVPWTLIADVPSAREDDICFKSEAFCGILAETGLAADGPVDFLGKAVRFLNEVVWGTLNCCLIVHPRNLEDPAFAAAFDKALSDLRYGTIGINYWPAIGYGLISPTWGAFPGHPLENIQSGRGVVHNTLMFEKAQKSVIRGPFRTSPLPPWFLSHRTTHGMGPKLTSFETKPGILKVPGILWSALRG